MDRHSFRKSPVISVYTSCPETHVEVCSYLFCYASSTLTPNGDDFPCMKDARASWLMSCFWPMECLMEYIIAYQGTMSPRNMDTNCIRGYK